MSRLLALALSRPTAAPTATSSASVFKTLYLPRRQAATSNFAPPPTPSSAGASGGGAAAPVSDEASRNASKARSDTIAGLVEGLGVALLRDAVAGEAPIAIATPTFQMEASRKTTAALANSTVGGGAVGLPAGLSLGDGDVVRAPVIQKGTRVRISLWDPLMFGAGTQKTPRRF